MHRAIIRLNRGEQRISPALSLRNYGSCIIGTALPRSFVQVFEFQGSQAAYSMLLRATMCYLSIVRCCRSACL